MIFKYKEKIHEQQGRHEFQANAHQTILSILTEESAKKVLAEKYCGRISVPLVWVVWSLMESSGRKDWIGTVRIEREVFINIFKSFGFRVIDDEILL